MWADYGNGGKGICLHYQYSPENAEKTNEFSFDEISYVETIKRDENVSLYDTLQHGFFTKHSDFKFENENRFITVADGDAIYKDTKLMGKSISEASLGIKLIAIDFGTDCSEEDKKKVFDVINARADSTSISFYQLKYGTAGSFTFYRTAISR